MPLSAGERLGPYEILTPIGAGGMGEVYQARDTRLRRTVAVKVLPPHAAGDAEQRKRMLHEARAVSALNHPNIVTIHDVLSEPGRDAIVMEYVVGETLEKRIGHMRLPLREALPYAIQIANALSAAHAAGIVHRDIKPGNIMVNEKGLVKILDFGLAKLTDPPEPGESGTTQTMLHVTEEGTIMGTVAYMSPEQAEGKKVDSRSDVFSFGSVLYEMTTGTRAFPGRTKISTLSAILHQDPKPLSEIAPALPREVERIISQCLKKDPSRRLQHMDDVSVLLEELKEQSESVGVAPAAVRGAAPGGGHWRIAVAAAALGLAVAVGATWTFLRNGRGDGTLFEAPVMRLTSDTGLTAEPAISPDGKLLAYASDRAGADNLDIWVQQIDGGAPLRLTSDTSDEYEPSFTPDGSRIIFRSERDGGGIYAIPALGGEVRLIAKGGRQARFSPDGARIACVTGEGGLSGVEDAELRVVPSIGGMAKKLVPADIGAASPVWSPDGKWILFAAGKYRIDAWAIVPSDLAEPITLEQFGSGTGDAGPVSILKLDQLRKSGLDELIPDQWLPGDRVVFSSTSGDVSHVFEIGLSPPSMRTKQWRLSSSAQRLTFGTSFDQGASLAAAGLGSGARRMVFASLVRNENLWSLDLDSDHPRPGAKLRQLTQENGFYVFPEVSWYGTRVVYISHAAYNDGVWLLDLERGKRSLLSTMVSAKRTSHISRDGSEVVYGDGATAAGGVYAIAVSGGAPTKICEKCNPYIKDWSPDRRRLLVWARGRGGSGVAIHNLETGKSGLYLDRPSTDFGGVRWSRDGQWLSFVTTQGARSRVYIAPFTSDEGPPENTWVPITDGSTLDKTPGWSADGRGIYFLSNRDGFLCIWACPLDPQTKKPAGVPTAVFHSHGARRSLRNASADSQRVSIARDKIVFNMGEITGNIWMTEVGRDQK